MMFMCPWTKHLAADYQQEADEAAPWVEVNNKKTIWIFIHWTSVKLQFTSYQVLTRPSLVNLEAPLPVKLGLVKLSLIDWFKQN